MNLNEITNKTTNWWVPTQILESVQYGIPITDGILIMFLIVILIFGITVDIFCNNPLKKKIVYRRKRTVNWIVLSFIQCIQTMARVSIIYIGYSEKGVNQIGVNLQTKELEWLISTGLILHFFSSIINGILIDIFYTRKILIIELLLQGLFIFLFFK
jgi:hypothetical protein